MQADVALVLDSGAVSELARRSGRATAIITVFRTRGLWPAQVPAAVLVECLTGQPGRDAGTNRFLKTCDVIEALPLNKARQAAALQYRAQTGSAVDAIVVALAAPSGTALTGDLDDLRALAVHTPGVVVEQV